jgi:uncharacterized protein (TIRG00374 family)
LTSGDKPKSRLKGILNYVLSLILAATFLYLAFYDVNFGDVLKIVSNASLLWVFVFMAVLMFAHYLRAIRWKIILSSVKSDTSVKNLFGAIMVGYGVNCVVPRLGEISRAVLVGKWENLSRSSMFGTVILERVIDIMFLGFSVLVALIFYSNRIMTSFPWLQDTLYITFFFIIVVFLFFYLAIKYKEKFYNVVVKFLGKFSEKFAHKVAYIFQMLGDGFGSLKGTKNYISTFTLSALIMILYALSSYVGFFMLGMQAIQPVSFQMAWVFMSISAIGVVIPTPGGTGSYHALAKSTLVLLFGFGEVISLAYAFLTHIVTYFLYIFSGLIVFFIINKQHDNLIKVVETEIEEL